ncbi:M3 family oligoendopeptidase [Bacillus sp. CGMCC 1.16607]|uniref:M3 family oligoendopeptidase n=1 Tax=Bacillus sp. CGMCC 1.16607 TaxID=3351842 RepID=UPI0036422DE2
MKFNEFAYIRPDIEKVKQELGQLIEVFKGAASAKEQLVAVGKINELRKEFESAQTIAHIRHTLDTTDPFYEAEFAFFNEKSPEYESVDSQYYRALLETPFRAELEQVLGSQLFRVAESRVKIFSPDVMDLLAEENRLTSEYQKLIATAKIPFDGGERSLSQMDKYLTDPDRDVRKSAACAKYVFFNQNAEVFDEIYDKMVKVRDSIAKKLGFKSFTELAYLRWNRTGWDANSAAAFRENILKHIVPLASDLIEKQRQRIGVDRVKIYDERFQFPSGNPTPKGDPDWIVEQGRELYSELSSQTKEFYEEMTDRGLFDLVNRNGKANVGYCTYLWKQQAPFVFANFNGTSNDIRVLVHEVGHAFQAYLALKEQEQPEYFFPTMEASEIFSMSMEFFVLPWAEKFFKEDSEKHRFAQLNDSLVKLPRMCAGDEFQHEVYANPELSPQERKDLWARIEKKYMPDRDNDHIPFLHEGGMWQEIIHIYEVPFYFIDYALAQVCALEFWRMANENWSETWETYMQLCRLGGSKSFSELIEAGNLKSPFEESTFVELKRFVEEKLGETGF